MAGIDVRQRFSDQLLSELRDMQSRMTDLRMEAQDSKLGDQSAQNSQKTSFMDHMTDSLSEVNSSQKIADKMATDLATGKSENIHETMLAASKAELNFNFLVQIRNKVIEAYQEVMRMQV